MHSPSPQLLRALRSSISPSTTFPRTTPSPIPRLTPPPRTTPSSILPLSHRHNSSSSNSSNSNSSSRPTRLIPRAHTAKPSPDRAADSNENKATDLNALNVLGNVPAPTTAVDATLDDGFHLDNGVRIRGGDGVLLVGGEAFAWRPWVTRASRAEMVNAKGQFEVDEEVWGLLGIVWPRPDLLIIGMGESMFPLSPETKKHINALGIRIEILDTRNAAAQFNMLATERGVSEIAAAMIPLGWKGR